MQFKSSSRCDLGLPRYWKITFDSIQANIIGRLPSRVMYAEIFSIIAPIIVCTGIGFAWAKMGYPYETDFITRLVTNVGAPCLVFSVLIKVDITLEMMAGMGLAALVSIIAFAVIAVPVLKVFRLSQRTFLPSMIFTNSGNMGLPLCLLAFGETGLALAISYFAVSVVLMCTFGPAIAAGSAKPGEFLRVPLIWSIGAALAIRVSEVALPVWAFKTADLVGGVTIPLMLITLGVSLAVIPIGNLRRSAALSVLRLGMGVFIGWGVAEVMGYEGVVRGVLILECAMPAAVFNYLHAQYYDNNPSDVASTVLSSTVLSFITLPLLLGFVM